MGKLAEAFKEMCAVSRVRSDLAAGGIEDAARRLWRVLGEYPEEVALKAIDEWPKTHQFFPTEAELRRELDAARKHARPGRKLPQYDDGMSDKPVGASRDFLDELRRLAPSKAEAYFDGGMARFSNARIGVRAKFVTELIEKHAPGLLAKHGVRLVEPHRYVDNGDGTVGLEWRWE